MELSGQIKESIKVGLAVVIAFGVAFKLGWDKPYWSAAAAAMCSLDTFGAGIQKAMNRLGGVIIGGTAAIVILSLAPQQRWGFIFLLSLHYGICTFKMTGSSRPYLWYVGAFVAIIVVVNAAPVNSADTFQIAVARLQENAMGILVFSLVQILLWPNTSDKGLWTATRGLTSTQRDLQAALGQVLLGAGSPDTVQSLSTKEVQLLGQTGGAFTNANTDSFEVQEMSDYWQRYIRLSTQLTDSLDRLQEALPEIEEVDLTKYLPNLDEFVSEIGKRLTSSADMLDDKAPTASPQDVKLTLDLGGSPAATPLQKASVELIKNRIETLDSITRDLYSCVAVLSKFAPPARREKTRAQRASFVPPDPDRIKDVVAMIATVWIAHLIYIYLHPDGQTNLVHLAVLFTLACIMMGLNPKILTVMLAQGSLLAGFCYMFVMPHLHSYYTLGTMLFLVVGVMFVITWPAKYRVTRSVVISLFFVLIFLNNEQTYSFTTYANTVLSAFLALFVSIVVMNGLGLLNHEKDFVDLIGRFFRQADFFLSRLGGEQSESSSLAERWKMAAARRDIGSIPKKLSGLKGKLDYDLLPGTTPDEVQTLTTRLTVLAHWLGEVDEARKLDQADVAKPILQRDVRQWRIALQEQYRNWAAPEEAGASPEDLQERLNAGLATLEKRITDMMGDAEDSAASESELENLYRALGAFRGLASSGIAYATAAGQIDWSPFKEARF